MFKHEIEIETYLHWNITIEIRYDCYRASITRNITRIQRKGINHAHHWTINHNKINDYIKRGRPLTIFLDLYYKKINICMRISQLGRHMAILGAESEHNQ